MSRYDLIRRMRVLGAVLAGVMLAGAPVRPQVAAPGAAAAVDPISGQATVLRLSNDYVMMIYGLSGTPGAIPAYAVTDTVLNGRWAVVTVGGDPTTAADNGVPVSAWNVCQYQVDPQVYTAVQAPGAASVVPWYRVGNPTDGAYIQAPAVDATAGTISSVWQSSATVTPSNTTGNNNNNNNNNNTATSYPAGINVEEHHTLMRDLVRAEYKFVNTTTGRRNVRVRIGIDPIERWPAGAQNLILDGSWMVNRRHVEYETDYQGAVVPNEWRVYGPDIFSPVMIVQGIIDRFDATRPDRFVIGSTGGGGPFGGGPWNYVINPSYRLDGAPGTNTDDAGFAYYDTFTLLPGDSKTIVTYTGLGCSYEDPTPPYVLATQSPRTLGFALGDDPSTAQPETSYLKPRTFTIRAYLYNCSLFDINSANLYLDLPPELTLVPGQTRVQNVGTILRTKEGVASWDVQADSSAAGEISYRVTGSGIPVPTKTVIGTIQVPAQATRTFDSGLRLMSVPFQFNNPDAQVALNLPTDRFKLARYDPSTRGYAYFPDAFVSTLQPGAGYWFKTDLRTAVNLQGAVPVPRGLLSNFILPIKAGWNMIGDPYVYPMPWANTQVSDGTQLLSLTQAANAGWLRPTIFSYNTLTSSYDFSNLNDALLEPWEGYWLRADRDLFLIMPPVSTPEATIDAPNQRSAAAGGWKIQIAARAGNAADLKNYAGVSSATPDGYDLSDIDEPPVPGEGYVSLRFVHNDWGKRSGYFTQDMRSDSFAGDKTWDVDVDTNQAGENVTLTWPNLNSRLPRGYTAYLEDAASGRKVYLRTQGSYTYRAEAAGAHRFRLVVSKRTGSPLVISGVDVQPLGGRAAGRSISFGFSADGFADVRIASLTGGTIRQLATHQAVTSGRNTLVWDGTNQRGATINSGIVIVEIIGTDPDGAAVRFSRPVVLTR